MPRIEHINPERLLWCCDDRGITPSVLAETLAIATGTMDAVMAGERGLTFNQLRRVAKFFGRGVLFFCEAGRVEEARVRTPQFRTLMNQKPGLLPEVKTLIERVEAQRQVYLGLREDDDPEDLEAFAPPAVLGMPARQAAAVAREWLGLGDENDFRAYREAVETRGLLVFLGVGYLGDWRLPDEWGVVGFSVYHEVSPAILVKKQRPEARQSFTLMHELGHVLMHRSSFIDDAEDLYQRRGREQEANAFAGHLLVPDRLLELVSRHDKPNDVAAFREWLRPYTRRWGVTTEVVLRRLLDARRLDRDEYEGYRRWRAALPAEDNNTGNRQYRHREPLHLFGNRYVRTVLDAFHDRRISLNKTSGYLDNLKIGDLHRLERYLAGH